MERDTALVDVAPSQDGLGWVGDRSGKATWRLRHHSRNICSYVDGYAHPTLANLELVTSRSSYHRQDFGSQLNNLERR